MIPALDTSYDTSLALPRKRSDQSPALVYLASLSAEKSRVTMAGVLDNIAGMLSPGSDLRSFPWHGLRFQHTQAIRARLAETYAPATANKYLCALRGTLKAAWQLGYMSAEDYHRAIALKGVKGKRLPAGRSISSGEVLALARACRQDSSPAGARDGALLALLYSGGLRRSEVVSLTVEDYNPDTGELKVRKGKGNKERIVWLQNGALGAMRDWLKVRGEHEGALFHPINKGGRIIPQHMSSQAVYIALNKRADEASVKSLSPHDFRRTFVGDLLDAGADIATVAALAGHESVETTARYDRRPEETKRKAAGLLHFPWREAA